MVPDTTDDGSDRTTDGDAPPADHAPGRGVAADRADDEAYDLVYRATRDALWDVLGTATLILFYLALTAVGLSVAVGGIGQFVRGSAGEAAAVIGLVGLGVGAFAALRVYRLATE